MPPVVGSQHKDEFSESRARIILRQLAALGPRPSGSQKLERDAFNILDSRINLATTNFEKTGVNRIEKDVQVLSPPIFLFCLFYKNHEPRTWWVKEETAVQRDKSLLSIWLSIWLTRPAGPDPV